MLRYNKKKLKKKESFGFCPDPDKFDPIAELNPVTHVKRAICGNLPSTDAAQTPAGRSAFLISCSPCIAYCYSVALLFVCFWLKWSRKQAGAMIR